MTITLQCNHIDINFTKQEARYPDTFIYITVYVRGRRAPCASACGPSAAARGASAAPPRCRRAAPAPPTTPAT